MQEVRKQVNLTIGERQIAELKAMKQKGVKIGEMAAALGLTYNKLHQNMRLLGMVKERKMDIQTPEGFFDIDKEWRNCYNLNDSL